LNDVPPNKRVRPNDLSLSVESEDTHDYVGVDGHRFTLVDPEALFAHNPITRG
jgi:hypothetical protein